MIRYVAFTMLIVFSSGCSDYDQKGSGENMNMSREEKFAVISKAGDSDDLEQASKIAPFLQDKDAEVVGRACFNLGYLGAREYIGEIEQFLNSEDEDLLVLCLSGLALMVNQQDEHLFEAVKPSTSHHSTLVRMSAVEVLGKIHSKSALPILLRNFEQEAPAVKYEIIKALGQIGETEAIPLLRGYQIEVEAMDHSVPRKGGVRGSAPHPDVLASAIEDAISALEN